MQKIITLFKRNYETDNLVRDEVVDGAEWVISGEGIATRKWDGTACLVKDNKIYKRYDAKKGKQPPKGFIPAQEPDHITGHWPGWIKVTDKPEDKWFNQAWINQFGNDGKMLDGTYELVGPKINNNPEDYATHVLIPHGWDRGLIPWDRCPRTFNEIKEWLIHFRVEGIVWHHPDGKMAKIKLKDFGIKR